MKSIVRDDDGSGFERIRRVLAVDMGGALVDKLEGSDSGPCFVDDSNADAMLAREDRFDVVMCRVRAGDDRAVRLYRRIARTHASLAPRVVFVTDDGLSARCHYFLRDVPNEVLDESDCVRALSTLVRRT